MRLESSGRKRPASLNAVVAEVAAAVLVHIAFWLLLLSMLSIRPELYTLIALAAFPILLYFVAKLNSVGKMTPVYAVFLPLLAGLIGARYFADGFRELFNYLAKAVNQVHEMALFPTGDGYPKTDTPATPGQLVILLLGFLMAGLFAYAICRKVRWLAIVTAVLPAAVALLSGLRPTMPAFIFYVVAALFYLILLETRSKGTARRLTWLNGELSAAMLIFLVLLALLLSGFERSENVEELRQQIAQKVTAFRYAPNETVDGMPGGDLNEAGALQYTGKTVLTVETPDAFSMYLRGYSGDVLENGRWVPLDSGAYFDDYSLTGPWIRSNYFSPAVSFGQLLDLKWQVQTTQYENGEREAMNLPRYPIKVRNELAFSDRMYAPYEVSAESKGLHHAELSQNGILSEGLRGKRSYELTVYRPLTKDYGNVSPKALIGEDAPYNSLYEDAFVPVEKVYRTFAQANERDIPEQYQGVMSELGAAVVGKTTKVSDATYRIRNYFTKNYQYSLDVAEPEPGQDPLLRFLESRTGYCTHFATLATLLYREAGIPARYAEGYFISEELAGSVEKETDVTLSVPDSAAHAWVEVYLDGVGWVPVEVTPGYFDTQNSSSGSSPQGQTVQPEETPQPEDNEDNDSEDGGGQDEEEAEEPEKQEKHHNFGWLILLVPLFLLLLLIPMVYERSVRKKIERADSPEATSLAFRYMMRVFRRQGLKPDEFRPRTVARLLGEEKEAYLGAIDLFNKETFSEGGLTPSEREAVCDTVLRLTSDIKLLRAARKQLRDETRNTTEVPHGK